MKIRLIPAATLVFVLVVSCNLSHAQYRTFFSPSLTVSEEFTNNLFLTDEDKESEFLTIVSPGVAFSVEGKGSGLELSYSPGFVFYQEHDDLNTVRHSASLNGQSQLARGLTLSIADNFTRSEEPYQRGELRLRPEAQTLEEFIDFTIRNEREPRTVNDAQVRMDYEFGRQDSVYAQYNHRLYRDDTPGAEDSDSHSPGFGFEYWLNTWNGFRGNAQYTRGLFDGSSDDFHSVDSNLRYMHNFDRFLAGFVEYNHLYTNFDGDEVDYNVYNPAAGLTYSFAEDASVEIGAGYFFQDRDDGENESGPTVTVDIQKTWRLKKGAFRVSGGSGYEQTYFGAENLGFTQYYEARASLEYYFTRHLQGDLSANYRFNRYLDEDPEREDHVATASAGLTYALTEWLSVSLRDTYRVVESDEEFNDYTENSVLLSVTAAPGPFRMN